MRLFCLLHAKLISSFTMLPAFTVACCSVQAIYKLILNAATESILQELILLPVALGDHTFFVQ